MDLALNTKDFCKSSVELKLDRCKAFTSLGITLKVMLRSLFNQLNK